MKLKDLSQIMLTAIHDGVAKAVTDSGVFAPLITKAEAYRIYGRSNVDRWLSERLIHLSPSTNNSKMLLDRLALERIAGNSNRNTYLPVADRKL